MEGRETVKNVVTSIQSLQDKRQRGRKCGHVVARTSDKVIQSCRREAATSAYDDHVSHTQSLHTAVQIVNFL